MSRSFLFVGADAGGNVPPLRAVAAELAGRGHRIAVAGLTPPDEGEDPIALPAIAGREPGPAAGGRAQLQGLMRMALSAALGRQVQDAIVRMRPDAIVIDAMMLTSIRAAVQTDAPVAVLFHSFGGLWGGPMARGPARTLLRPFGLSPTAVWQSAAARLLVTDRELDPLTDAEDIVGFEWTGTTEHGVAPLPRQSGEPPLILVSLSSVWQKDQDAVYARIISALDALPVRAIVTRSAPRDPYPGEIPPHLEMRGRASHAEILPRADLVIGHGGHSTTLAALAHGVPLLVLPMNQNSDQPMIGRIVQRNGLGLTLSRGASSVAIGGAIRRILADERITQRAAATGQRLRAQNGARVAADRIEALAVR